MDHAGFSRERRESWVLGYINIEEEKRGAIFLRKKQRKGKRSG